MYALLDLFLTHILWFIMDENAQPTFYEDQNNGVLYQVLPIFRSSNLVCLLSEDEEEPQDEEETVHLSSKAITETSFSKRMLS